MKLLKRLFCKHDKVLPDHTYYIRQQDGSWLAQHVWRCVRCGKKLRTKKKKINKRTGQAARNMIRSEYKSYGVLEYMKSKGHNVKGEMK